MLFFVFVFSLSSGRRLLHQTNTKSGKSFVVLSALLERVLLSARHRQSLCLFTSRRVS